MQPIYLDPDGTPRFKNNAIVRKLLDEKFFSLSDIAMRLSDVPVEDAEQFWQLLGYSTSAYGDLSFVRPKIIAEADAEAAALLEKKKKIKKMKPGARFQLVWAGKLLDSIIELLRATLNADAKTGDRTNDFTREEWADLVLLVDRLEGTGSSLWSIVTEDEELVAACGTSENPHPDDGEIYDDGGSLHIHVGRKCLAIVKNHNPDIGESDEDRAKRIDELRFMVTGARSTRPMKIEKKPKKKNTVKKS